MLNRLPSGFINHIELWLSGAGLVIIFGVSLLAGPPDLAFWRLIAIIAIAIGVLHGFIFWAVRQRQRQIRRQSIEEIQAMLADVVKNKLTVINMYLPEENQAIVEEQMQGIQTSIRDIAEQVESLSEKRLHDWKHHYDEVLQRTTDLEAST